MLNFLEVTSAVSQSLFLYRFSAVIVLVLIACNLGIIVLGLLNLIMVIFNRKTDTIQENYTAIKVVAGLVILLILTVLGTVLTGWIFFIINIIRLIFFIVYLVYSIRVAIALKRERN